MTKETKLRIHNITAKAVLKFGSEEWVMKKKRQTTFRSSTDEISETLTGNYEIR
jgi:TfoX/Sxy family transcriptional regulator of competence genes